MVKTLNDCKAFQAAIPDLLLRESPLESHSASGRHLAACAACSREWTGLQATWVALDDWQSPEPTPFFDARMQARLREAMASPPESFLERMHSFFLFSTGRQLRPALGAALALVMLVGGGSGLIGLHQHRAANDAASHTLNDLKVLDNNAQVLQQMDQLLDDGDDDGGAPPTT